MTSTLATASSSLFSFNPNPTNPSPPPNLRFAPPIPHRRRRVPRLTVRAHSSNANTTPATTNPILHGLKTLARTAIFAAAVAGKFSTFPARAEPPVAVTEQSHVLEEQQKQHESENDGNPNETTTSPLSEFLERNDEAVGALKSLLQQKLEVGEDEEALKILKRLVSAQPEVTDWKFLMARLLNEMGKAENARNVYEEILSVNPLSFEALFENALLMDRMGEGEAVIKRLEEALRVAEEKNKEKEARDVRLIIAQIKFLQKHVDEALGVYEGLTKEDPSDFRPYFCRGMIYSLLDKNDEAREQFAKYRELSPKKFEVDGYLRTPLSRMKLFGADES